MVVLGADLRSSPKHPSAVRKDSAARRDLVVLGVDLRSSPKHPSAVAALDSHAEVTYLGTAHADDELVQLIQTLQPSLIAIGTPLGLPDGLCCLETSCNCQTSSPHRKGRQLELELSRMGISCFFTGKGSIISSLIYRGIKLRRQLSDMGLEVIEVYPHATKVVLFGDKVPPKNNPQNLDFMKKHLPGLIQGLEPYLPSMDRNLYDAVVNSYTAYLHSQDSTDLLGSQKEGFLALPKLFPNETPIISV
jgi:predicted nuclease with RNAse H fold